MASYFSTVLKVANFVQRKLQFAERINILFSLERIAGELMQQHAVNSFDGSK